jgi:hypothetical protein
MRCNRRPAAGPGAHQSRRHVRKEGDEGTELCGTGMRAGGRGLPPRVSKHLHVLGLLACSKPHAFLVMTVAAGAPASHLRPPKPQLRPLAGRRRSHVVAQPERRRATPTGRGLAHAVVARAAERAGPGHGAGAGDCVDGQRRGHLPQVGSWVLLGPRALGAEISGRCSCAPSSGLGRYVARLMEQVPTAIQGPPLPWQPTGRPTWHALMHHATPLPTALAATLKTCARARRCAACGCSMTVPAPSSARRAAASTQSHPQPPQPKPQQQRLLPAAQWRLRPRAGGGAAGSGAVVGAAPQVRGAAARRRWAQSAGGRAGRLQTAGTAAATGRATAFGRAPAAPGTTAALQQAPLRPLAQQGPSVALRALGWW